MADPFSSFARAPGAPYTRAVALGESPDEIEVTAALYCNVTNVVAQVVMADDDTPVILNLWGPAVHEFRVRKVLNMSGYTTLNATVPGGKLPRLLGLY